MPCNKNNNARTPDVVQKNVRLRKTKWFQFAIKSVQYVSKKGTEQNIFNIFLA